MNEKQIKEVMRLADAIRTAHAADWDVSRVVEAQNELEAYLRTISKPESVNAGMLKVLKKAEDYFCGPTEWTLVQEDHLVQSLVDVIARAESAIETPANASQRAFHLGDLVKKVSGSEWQGRIVGQYSTSLTPEGYAVESDAHPGSVQIYPANALISVKQEANEAGGAA